MRALEAAGAIDCTKLSRHYTGVGSKYYDLVTEQIELTARWSIRAVRALFAGESPDAEQSA
jgi:hypothetical protein